MKRVWKGEKSEKSIKRVKRVNRTSGSLKISNWDNLEHFEISHFISK